MAQDSVKSKKGIPKSAMGDGGDKEIDAQNFFVVNTRFYVNIKENNSGRYVKFSSASFTGMRCRMNMPLKAIAQFRNRLDDFIDFHDNISENGEDDANELGDQVITAFVVFDSLHCYFMDLKKSRRGYFLRVSHAFVRRSPFNHFALPAIGMKQLRNVIDVFIQKYQLENESKTGESAEHNMGHIIVGEKHIFFDVDKKKRGTNLRITQITPHGRSFISVPQTEWSKFTEIIGEIGEKHKIGEESENEKKVAACPKDTKCF